MNIAAFRWGRRAAHQPDFVRDLVARSAQPASQPISRTLDEIIERRAQFLTAYQDEAYAERYRSRIARLRAAEEKVAPGSTAVTEAAARNLFKLMAVKDEYEVARLYTDGAFQRQLANEFESFDKLEFHLAPPMFARRDSQGNLKKARYGQWMLKAFGVLTRFKRLRGTPFDPFGLTAERRMERRLLKQYESDLDRIENSLAPDRIEAAAALAMVPALIRGFGHVKEANVGKAEEERARLIERFEKTDPDPLLQAAE